MRLDSLILLKKKISLFRFSRYHSDCKIKSLGEIRCNSLAMSIDKQHNQLQLIFLNKKI